MSLAALLHGVHDHLLADRDLALREGKDLGIRAIDGKPPAWPSRSHDRYYLSIHPTHWGPSPDSNSQVHMGLDEVYNVALTLTKRVGEIPPSKRTSKGYLEEIDGLEARARKILVVMISGRYDILTLANARITGSDDEKIYEPLLWAGSDASPVERGPEWFTAESRDPAAHGWTLTQHFHGARRSQTITSSMT